MPAQTDPLTTAMLVGFIVSLLIFISRLYEARLTDRDKTIADRDKTIDKLEQSIDDMAERSSSLATSADRMLTYFLDREAQARDAAPSSPPSDGRPSP